MGKLDVKQSIVIGRSVNKSWDNEATPATIDGAPAGGRFCDFGKVGNMADMIHKSMNASTLE